ncbi:biotin-dependent carboxyltransferase family protein [Martelella alba]|uniref:Biotin-dependent carboxyltransferase family protein n=1 Tax=Martelella alba TaxID=2590451 RepID=A0A506U772_9HYPH|nr:biotin-dependent carboxyltransferase family protein [Martelella alba]TPW29700.1 biotin-dependent carboxyltransferase family protein [Martelella alba]
MNGLTVITAGLLSTVQAKARLGHMRQGISPAGPMDPDAFAIAQALVGNDHAAAGLEFAQSGGRYRAEEPLRFAVTGGAVDIRIDARPVAAWESHMLMPGETLTVGYLRDAIWGYVAFSGGIDVPEVLGSRATHLRSAIGGFAGRALRDGDQMPLGVTNEAPCLCLGLPVLRFSGPVRVIAGPQDDYFDDDAWALFLGSDFTVSNSRDRMASRLDGPLLHAFRGHDIISDATPLGSIQVPGSGRPYVLTAERQTTGGYPKIATVASADLPRLAQLPSSKPFRFSRISQALAEEALLAARWHLADVLATLVEKPSG